MKEFLKKYLTADQITELESKYVAEHPEAKGLPVYISKARLDEEIGKKKVAEGNVTNLTAEIEKLKTSNEAAIKTAIDEATKKLNEEHALALSTQKKDFDATEAIYKAKGRNVKAIKALIDPEKELSKEIERLQKEEPYLFVAGKDDVPPGTGKDGDGSGAGGDGVTAAMRKAVLG